MRTSIFIIICLLSIKGFCQKETTLFKNNDLVIYKKSAYFKDKELYNAGKDVQKLIESEKTDECSVDYEFYYNPLSLVGNYYSYESGEGGIIACGAPSNSLSIQTINLDDNKTVSLSDIFTEQSILKALKEDIWIKKMEEELKTDFQSINSFEVFLDTINSLNFVKFKSSSFAILDFDRKNGNVAVRFVGAEYMGYNHNKYLQLGLWLEPKQSFKQLLKNEIYFTLGDYKNGVKE